MSSPTSKLPHTRTLKLDMGMTSSMPTSSISMTSPEKHLTHTRLCGRFLLCVPTRNSEASFLTDQNESDEASSNGRTAFDLENEIECGFLSWFYGYRRQCVLPCAFF